MRPPHDRRRRVRAATLLRWRAELRRNRLRALLLAALFTAAATGIAALGWHWAGR